MNEYYYIVWARPEFQEPKMAGIFTSKEKALEVKQKIENMEYEKIYVDIRKWKINKRYPYLLIGVGGDDDE